MTSLLRRATAAAGVIALASGAAALAAAPAYAAPPANPADANVLIFDNPTIVDADPGAEVDRVTDVVTALGGTVTTFDGGDASATAWTTALTGIDVLVLPEIENTGDIEFYVLGGTTVVSDAAATAIAAWTAAGGYIVANGTYAEEPETDYPSYGELLNVLTGKDYNSQFMRSDDNTMVWELQVVLDGAPATVPYVDGSYGLSQYGAWSADLKSIVTPIYVTADDQNLGVGTFAVGAGAFVYVGYDWYPDGSASEEAIASWTLIQQLAVSGALAPGLALIPVPALAATGTDLVPVGSIAVLLLLAGVGVLVIRQRGAV